MVMVCMGDGWLLKEKKWKIAEPVQNECEVSLAMTAVLRPKAVAKGDSIN